VLSLFSLMELLRSDQIEFENRLEQRMKFDNFAELVKSTIESKTREWKKLSQIHVERIH
jgi:hypothetical protein